MSGEPTVVAVIVTYRRTDILREALLRLKRQTRPVDELIVVDNSPGGETTSMVTAEFPEVSYLPIPENIGAPGGYAKGMRHALDLGADFVWVFNDDNYTEPGALAACLEVALSREGGIVTPWHEIDDRIQRGYFWQRGPVAVTEVKMAPYQVDLVLLGAALISRATCEQIGYPRADYFIGFWEWEYCLRAKTAGVQIWVAPEIGVINLAAGSTGSSPPWRLYYQTRNHLRTVLERRSVSEIAWWARRLVKMMVAATLFRDQKAKRLQMRVLGIWHGLVGKMGRRVIPEVSKQTAVPQNSSPTDLREYWEDRLARHAGLRGVGHISHSAQFNRWLYRVKRVVFERALAKSSLEVGRARVLDVGSGTGFVVDEWIRLGAASVVASDFTSVATSNLRSRLPGLEVIQMDIGAANSVGSLGQFDAVSAFEVLFHIRDDDRYVQALRNIASLLRPGGFFFYTDNFLHDHALQGYFQVSRTLSDITTAIESAGMTVERRQPLAVFLTPPVDTFFPLWLPLWQRTIGRAARGRRMGHLVGALLAPVDTLLTRLPLDGPSVELMTCRRQDFS